MAGSRTCLSDFGSSAAVCVSLVGLFATGDALAGPTPKGRIAFVREGNLYLCRPDGSGLRHIARGGLFDQRCHYPAWMPDGRHLTYTRSYGDEAVSDSDLVSMTRVLIFDTVTNNSRALFLHVKRWPVEIWRDYLSWGRTAWHPSGQKAALVWPGFYADNDLILMYADGLQMRVFDRSRRGFVGLDGGGYAGGGYTPPWSPDGRALVTAWWPCFDLSIEDQEDGRRQMGIYYKTAASDRPRQLTNTPGDSNPVFTPDGRRVLFLRFNQTWCVDVASKRQWQLGTLKSLKLYMEHFPPGPDDYPGGRLLGAYPPEVTWSPDRRHLAYVTPSDLTDHNRPSRTLYVSDRYGRNVVKIAENAESPAWSPR